MFWEGSSSSAPWMPSKEMLRTGKGGGDGRRERFLPWSGTGFSQRLDPWWWHKLMCMHARSVTSGVFDSCNPMHRALPGSSVHGFSRQEHRSGVTGPPPGDLPDPGIEAVSLMSPALAGGLFATSAIWEAPNPWGSLKEVSHSYTGLTCWPSKFSKWSFLFQLLKSDILLRLPEKLKMTPWHFQIVDGCPKFIKWQTLMIPRGFPGGSDGKESACNAGDLGLIPGSGRSKRKWQPTLVFWPGKPHGQRGLAGYSP